MSSSSTVVLKLFKTTLPLFFKKFHFPFSSSQFLPDKSTIHSLTYLKPPRAQTSGFRFLVACNSLYYIFSPPNVYILTFSKTEPQTLPVLAQGIYYTIPEAEEDGQLLGGIVRDQRIWTQWQGNIFFCGSYLLASSYRMYSDTPQRESHCSSRGRKKWARQQSDSQSLYIIQIANIVYF